MTVKNTKENRGKCVCPGCPSYPAGRNCADELLYCSSQVGHSRCDIDAKGCVCPGCPVWTENNLKEIYFCTRDVAGEGKVVMRKKKKKESEDFFQTLLDIKTIAETGKSAVSSMGSRKRIACNMSLDSLQFVPAQVSRIPLDREEKVRTETIIGPGAKKPLKVGSPIMLSGMSFGATSKKVHLVISQVARELGIAFNSGEGGILDELFKSKEYLIGQYATGRFGVNEDVLKKVAAIEIRFGQGAYPGKGSFLPARKMTDEVSRLRGLKTGEPSYSPAHHHDMKTPEEIASKVKWLREISGGVPIGAKIGCGRIEEDVKILVDAKIDFIALDGFGGGTGATENFVKNNVGVPVVAAVSRANETLNKLGAREKISLIAAGGLRTSADFAKCIALGADAVYIGTAALIAINCQQYRVCHTGLCPTGVTTHDPNLARQLDVGDGVRKLKNFLNVSIKEISELARICGKNDIREISREDLIALNKETAEATGTRWVGNR